MNNTLINKPKHKMAFSKFHMLSKKQRRQPGMELEKPNTRKKLVWNIVFFLGLLLLLACFGLMFLWCMICLFLQYKIVFSSACCLLYCVSQAGQQLHSREYRGKQRNKSRNIAKKQRARARSNNRQQQEEQSQQYAQQWEDWNKTNERLLK